MHFCRLVSLVSFIVVRSNKQHSANFRTKVRIVVRDSHVHTVLCGIFVASSFHVLPLGFGRFYYCHEMGRENERTNDENQIVNGGPRSDNNYLTALNTVPWGRCGARRGP